MSLLVVMTDKNIIWKLQILQKHYYNCLRTTYRSPNIYVGPRTTVYEHIKRLENSDSAYLLCLTGNRKEAGYQVSEKLLMSRGCTWR